MTAPDLDEATVRAAGRDPEAMERLYRCYADAVWMFAMRRCGDADEAADLVADVFVAALESAHRFDSRRGRPTAWLLGIASRTLADRHRRRQRERRATARLLGHRLLEPDERAAVEARIDAERRAGGLADHLEALPDGERSLFELVAFHELSPSEAARALGIRPGAARVRLARARRRLRGIARTEPVPAPAEGSC